MTSVPDAMEHAHQLTALDAFEQQVYVIRGQIVILETAQRLAGEATAQLLEDLSRLRETLSPR